MLTQALGLIETIGLAAAVEAADTATKSSNVRLIGYELTRGDGMVTIKIEGDVGAVKAAIQSAKISAEKVCGVYSTLIIPRPAKGIDAIVCSADTVGIAPVAVTEEAEAASEESVNEPSSTEETAGEEEVSITVEPPAVEEPPIDEEPPPEELPAEEPPPEGPPAEEPPPEEPPPEEPPAEEPPLEEPSAEEQPTEEPSAEKPPKKPRRAPRKKQPKNGDA
jgi:microcompartment protein CcmL/EutN